MNQTGTFYNINFLGEVRGWFGTLGRGLSSSRSRIEHAVGPIKVVNYWWDETLLGVYSLTLKPKRSTVGEARSDVQFEIRGRIAKYSENL